MSTQPVGRSASPNDGTASSPLPPPAEPMLLTPQEAAQQLRLGLTKVYELLASGALESIKIGTARRVPRDAIDNFIASLRVQDSRLSA